MSELKPCPFCGWEFAEHAWNEFGEEYRVCDQCGATSGTVNSMWDWQSRPIEDALRKRIAGLKAWINKFIAEGEYLSLLNGLVNGDSDWGNLVADYWKEREE